MSCPHPKKKREPVTAIVVDEQKLRGATVMRLTRCATCRFIKVERHNIYVYENWGWMREARAGDGLP